MSLVAAYPVERVAYFGRDRGRIGELRKGRKQNIGLPKPLDRPLVAVAVNNGLQEPVSGGIDRKNHGLRLSPAHHSHQPSINQARTAVGTATSCGSSRFTSVRVATMPLHGEALMVRPAVPRQPPSTTIYFWHPTASKYIVCYAIVDVQFGSAHPFRRSLVAHHRQVVVHYCQTD